MVRIGKLFASKTKDDDASIFKKKFGKKSLSSPPTQVEVIKTTIAEPVCQDVSSPSSGRTRKTSGNSRTQSKQSVVAPAPSPVPEEVEDESEEEEEEEEQRDEAPSPENVPFSPDPVGVRGSTLIGANDEEQRAPLETETSASADEQSFEETVQSSVQSSGEDVSRASNGYRESEPAETYEEEEEEECSEEGTLEENEKSFESGNDLQEHDNTTAFSNTRSVGTTKGNEMSKKYFHKDVVLNSLEDGANSLVIRAMYFIPKPKAENHVVVKIEASTISARDCMKCKGHGLTAAMLPFVPGFEVVGTIQTLGAQTKADAQFREGDRVAGVSTFGGGNSRFISIPASRLSKISNNVKSTQAVCLISHYMAALRSLRLAKKAGSPFTGMNILITDGFSPVGQAVIVLAKMEGANIYCCADESKHAYLATLGVKCFVKETDAWLPSATGTFDVVIDNSCLDSYSSSWFALNQKGSLVVVAPVYNIDTDEISSSGCGVIDTVELKQKWASLKAKYMMTQTSFINMETCYEDDTEQYKQDLRYLMFLLEKGDIKPKVAERVSLEDVPDAQRLMQSGRANGTVVCVPWIEG